jgi:hypothetical protein
MRIDIDDDDNIDDDIDIDDDDKITLSSVLAINRIDTSRGVHASTTAPSDSSINTVTLGRSY